MELTSITPIDGRYRRKTQELSRYLSEFALIKNRVEIEIRYLIALSKSKIIRKLTSEEILFFENIYEKFSLKDAIIIKKLENETRHDIKAVEKFLIIKLKTTTLNDFTEYIHICLTSEDINNISYRLMLKTSINNVFLNKLIEIEKSLFKISHKHKKTAMLGRTHGQPAVPTTFGKEIFKSTAFAGDLNSFVSSTTLFSPSERDARVERIPLVSSM